MSGQEISDKLTPLKDSSELSGINGDIQTNKTNT